MLVPTIKVEKYLMAKGAVSKNATEAEFDHFQSFSKPGHPINLTIFRNHGHGDWPLETTSSRLVANAAEAILSQITIEHTASGY